MASTGDLACEFVGCGRRFKRQEHLTRHQGSHNPANIFVCEVCQREFNRKDSLHRHQMLHSDVLTPQLPKKTKRACIACRRGKNKCDGEAKCSACIRKDLECRYHDGEEEDDVRMGGTSDDINPQQNKQHDGVELPKESNKDMQDNNNRRIFQFAGSQSKPIPRINQQTIVPNEQPTHQPPFIPVSFEKGKLINWMSVQVCQDPVTPVVVAATEEAETREEKLNSALYAEEFFKSFHHRWALIHRPTYEMASSDTKLLASIRMIGAWLIGTADSRRFAWATHEKCISEFLPKLHRVTCHDNLWDGLPPMLCHSVVLNIIFSLYTGDQTDISRSFILLKTLVAALREVGFFDEDTAWPDEKPKLFLPMRMCALGQRQRLTTYLFKIDAYLSILRNQPPSLSPEDLYFTLPTTYALYNSDGLHILDERYISEPKYRNQLSTFKMINDKFSEAYEVETNPMLIEDIQTCLCAAWSSIWRISKSQKLLNTFGPTITPERVALRQQLDVLKARLDRIGIQLSTTPMYDQGDRYLPTKYYFGYEDCTLSSSTAPVVMRMQDLLADAIMLYHLLSITLSTNVAMLIRLVKDSNLSPVEELSEAHGQARSERLFLVKSWATSPNARRSLCHSVDILMTCRSLSQNPDPISHIALSFAAIVVHAFCIYGSCACVMCVPNPLVPVVEMTTWSSPGLETFKDEREAWIEVGAGFRPQLQGIQMCRCNSGFLVEFYKTYLPMGWEIANMIPNVQACNR